MEPYDLFELHADFCKTLAHPTRLRIIALLARKERSVGEIAEVVGVSLSNVSQHLSVLKFRNLVNTRKEGQTVYYGLTDRRIIQACTTIRSILLDNMKHRGGVAQEADARYAITEP